MRHDRFPWILPTVITLPAKPVKDLFMKFSFLALALFISSGFFAQSVPFGFSQTQEEVNQLVIYEAQTFDSQALIAEAESRDKQGYPSAYGQITEDALNSWTAGVWTVLSNGDRVWQLRFRSAGALAVNAFFSHMYLPEGSFMYIYGPDRIQVEGPYTWEDNTTEGGFQTAEILGDEAILEYLEPASVISQPRLDIRGFGHFFRFIHEYLDTRGGSEACQVDVNCPEGAGWAPERNSVVRLSIVDGNGIGLCTGSLVNNTSRNCRNFILTAYHCTQGVSTSDLNLMQVRFNFQRPNCGSGLGSSTQNRIGVAQRAHSNDGGGYTGSDFALLELNSTIPSNYQPFYAGWDASGTTPQSSGGIRGRCIHHPSGDLKKISTSNNITTATWPGGAVANHHWRVQWMSTQTNWGVTEGGSSGSPLYDINKRIIGTLTGGGSYCNQPSVADYYGRMDRHWSSNPNSSGMKLRVWLDPTNSGVLSLNGSFVDPSNTAQPCGGTAVNVEEFEYHDFKIFPSLASDYISISSSIFDEVREVRIFGPDGKLVQSLRLSGEITRIPVDQLSTGLYYVAFIHSTGTHVTQKFQVVR